MLTADDINMFTDDGCAVTKYPISNESTYTTAILFTLENINSSCQHISCFTRFREETKHINIGKCYFYASYIQIHLGMINFSVTTNVSGSIPTAGCNPLPEFGSVPDETGGGVLGIYRITLWIIVLTLTVLSTTMNSLTLNFM